MAIKVTATVYGGQPKILENVSTVQDVLDEMELDGTFAVSANGQPVDVSTELADYAFVSISPAVKGGLI